jgi:hypothetical protein
MHIMLLGGVISDNLFQLGDKQHTLLKGFHINNSAWGWHCTSSASPSFIPPLSLPYICFTLPPKLNIFIELCTLGQWFNRLYWMCYLNVRRVLPLCISLRYAILTTLSKTRAVTTFAFPN